MFLGFVVLMTSGNTSAQVSKNEIPMIGAEIFIEPGQQPDQIEHWFQVLAENKMTITRIRLTENFMRNHEGAWDYSLYDHAFRMGEKYDIKIYGNLFPQTSFTNIGGFKLPSGASHLDSIRRYIANVVPHFAKFKSCYGWVPINEPGSGTLPNDPYTRAKLQEWATKNRPVLNSPYVAFDFSEERFLLDYNTWFLSWLVSEIRKYDPLRPVHVNTHAIFSNVAEYDFPAWRNFLSSLGGSAHASWHFGYFSRDKYAHAVSANSEIIRSGAGGLPWLMTELQGGINTYSGNIPLNPTTEEITQWLWVVLACEGKGGIFWSLNARGSGKEAGEWAMLNYQQGASERLAAAARVAGTVRDHDPLIATARVKESGITILYAREALWNEMKQQTSNLPIEGRLPGGVMKSALAYFETLTELGLQANFSEIGEYDFSKDDYAGKAIILANQIAVPAKYWPLLHSFVNYGGKLIVEGLSGFYDENGVSLVSTTFPFVDLFGGTLIEYELADSAVIKIPAMSKGLTTALWTGAVKVNSGQVIASVDAKPAGIRNRFGRGEVTWIPSLLGLSSRVNRDYSFLSAFLMNELHGSIADEPVRFHEFYPGMILRTCQSGNKFITVVINKSRKQQQVTFATKGINNPRIIFSDKQGKVKGAKLSISPEETMVLVWDNQK